MKIQATDYRRKYLHDTYLRRSLYPEYISKTHSKIKRQIRFKLTTHLRRLCESLIHT